MKWSVDPRNSTWSNDDSKFGQKMLERMGWSKGKASAQNPDMVSVILGLLYKCVSVKQTCVCVCVRRAWAEVSKAPPTTSR